MTSQSKLDPFSCIVVHGLRSARIPYFEKVQHLKEKSRAKTFFAKVIRAVAKVYLCETFRGYWHFNYDYSGAFGGEFVTFDLLTTFVTSSFFCIS